MFKNPGEKIKVVAIVLFVLGVSGSVIYGIVTIALNPSLLLITLLRIIIGIAASWLSSLLIYGFGELISSNNHAETSLADMKTDLSKRLESIDAKLAANTAAAPPAAPISSAAAVSSEIAVESCEAAPTETAETASARALLTPNELRELYYKKEHGIITEEEYKRLLSGAASEK